MGERLLLTLCGILGAFVTILAVNCENAEIVAHADEIEQFNTEETKTAEKGQITIQTACLAELYAERRKNESQAGEEAEMPEADEAEQTGGEGTQEESELLVHEAESEMEESPAVEDQPIEICIDGDIFDSEVAGYLKHRLEEKGIGWWMPYAVCQAHQESSFQTDQITNGLDYGLFQYRIIYWQEWEDRAGAGRGDILNPYHQIDVYTEMVRQWLEEGRSIEETIGAHNYGGWTREYDPQYVQDVMRWMR